MAATVVVPGEDGVWHLWPTSDMQGALDELQAVAERELGYTLAEMFMAEVVGSLVAHIVDETTEAA